MESITQYNPHCEATHRAGYSESKGGPWEVKHILALVSAGSCLKSVFSQKNKIHMQE